MWGSNSSGRLLDVFEWGNLGKLVFMLNVQNSNLHFYVATIFHHKCAVLCKDISKYIAYINILTKIIECFYTLSEGIFDFLICCICWF